MKQLTKDTGGQLKPKPSQANSEIQSMSLSASISGAPKKKPVFKAIGSSSNTAVVGSPASLAGVLDVNNPSTATEENDPSGAVRNGYGYVEVVLPLQESDWANLATRWYAERYEPEFISGCDSDCEACGGREGRIAI